jgi:hypothetical protein
MNQYLEKEMIFATPLLWLVYIEEASAAIFAEP